MSFGGGGSGGQQVPTSQTVYQSSLPEYAEPYVTRLMKRAEAESLQPYSPYGGQRLAYFSPDELTAQGMQRGYALAGTPQEFQQAGNILGGFQGYGNGYQAGQFDAGYTAGQVSPTYQAENLGRPQYRASEFNVGYIPQDRTSQYQVGALGADFQPMSFEEGINRFMSPYQQAVIDQAKESARKESEKSREQIESQAALSGGLGGYREAILQAEREKGLAKQLTDIQTAGSQEAYNQALQQLGAERQVGLQQAQLGLQRFGALEQARQNQEQMQQQAFQFGEQARQQAAQMGLSAQEASDAARRAQEQFRQSAYQAQQQALQTQGQQQLAAYQAGESARQQAAQLGLSAQQQEQAARQAEEQFRQSAYQMTQQYGQQAAQGLLGLGQARQADVQQRIAALQGIGSQQRALQQAGLDIGYQDYLKQLQYPQQQLGFVSNIYRGVPIQPQQTTSTYEQQPGLFQQTLGLGLGGLGLYRGMMG